MSDEIVPAADRKRWWRIGPRATAALVVVVAFVVGGLAGASLLREFGHRERDGGTRFVPGMKFTSVPLKLISFLLSFETC